MNQQYTDKVQWTSRLKTQKRPSEQIQQWPTRSEKRKWQIKFRIQVGQGAYLSDLEKDLWHAFMWS